MSDLVSITLIKMVLKRHIFSIPFYELTRLIAKKELLGVSFEHFFTLSKTWKKNWVYLLWDRKNSHARSLVVSRLIALWVSSLRRWKNSGSVLLPTEPSKNSLNANLATLFSFAIWHLDPWRNFPECPCWFFTVFSHPAIYPNPGFNHTLSLQKV